MRYLHHLLVVSALAMTAGAANAFVPLAPGDASDVSTTLVTANIQPQCSFVIPSTLSFTVTDASLPTPADAAFPVTVTNAVIPFGTTLHLQISAQNDGFMGVNNEAGYSLSDLTWSSTGWSGGTGATPSLAANAFNDVATLTAGQTNLTTNDLQFVLKSDPHVTIADSYGLQLQWKVCTE